MTDQHQGSVGRRPTANFPIVALGLCAVALIGAALWLTIDRPSAAPSAATPGAGLPSGTGGVEFGQGTADPDVDVEALLDRSANEMGSVSSVEFELERTGAPVYIDQFSTLALDHLVGQFALPANAQATIDITVDGNIKTRIGAIALDDEVWISNPVTGKFETLPPGYDIDPSRFFDPRGGWQPLIEHIQQPTLVGIERRDGFDTYHVRGQTQADDVSNITVGLIRGQDVPIDLWIDPGSGLVTHAELVTSVDGEESTWNLSLRKYGANFDIAAPPEDAK